MLTDMEFIIKEVNDDSTKVISGMNNKVSISGEYMSYLLIGVAEVKEEETELWKERDFYEERVIKRSAITEIGLGWLHNHNQWEIALTVTGSTNDVGLRFSYSDVKEAKEVFSSIKQWWING